jgi:tetratricopeptide (TPR) repeat protein
VKLLAIILLYLSSITCFPQNKTLDSLWSVYNNKSQADTNRLKAIDVLAWQLRINKPDTAIILAEQELNLANVIPNDKGKQWVANAFKTLGASYKNKNNYPKSLEYLLKALKVYEEIGNQQGVADCYRNIGIVYKNQSDYAKALEYYTKALHIREKLGDKKGMGDCYTNIGTVYGNQSNYPKALEYFLKALKKKGETGDKNGEGFCRNNIGEIYRLQYDYKTASENYLKALQLFKKTSDKNGIGLCYVNLGALYNNLSDFNRAVLYSDSCIKASKETADIDNARLAYQNLADAYAKTNKYKEAYESHVKFKQLTDSIFNADNSKQLGDMKTNFEVEKKEAELKIKSDAEKDKLKAVASEENKRQRVVIYSVAGVLFIVVIFSLILLKRFRITHRQKQVIEEQKKLVDKAYEELHEKNKEVMDSIKYAKRIQNALITSEKYIENSLSKLIKN